MILFFIVTAAYTSLLLFYKPSPNSLKDAPLTFVENFTQIRAALFSGLLFFSIFLFTSDFGFDEVNQQLYRLFALNNISAAAILWPLQSITHLFIHINFAHVLTNVAGLGIAAAYERQVGSARFMMVLLVASLSSIPSILFYSEPIAICGISGGIFGLAAAYFTDQEGLSTKEWLYAVLICIVLLALLSVGGKIDSTATGALQFKIDHYGHALGALGAIVYCRFRPRKLAGNSRLAS
ncbi:MULTISPECIES: rhomboid family intramembrane serine protease [Methylomonas]|uniref:Rhomboid family intramembrane serine protease n=2 Tax=Methylomonas TaxID=416 RepID=A0A140E779_9GAMM|nr:MULTISPECIES: rhomboid family intramembrane serine protease [Methylomonas]AMK79253.1 rhomboid family intramembrane serine protease [Methylomonas denitrificans]OAH98118.1 rhomboid family intramembrane serine protease [Methylomonas methanica]TCV86228.1 membrane associated rhomboid family serine protease [Methylomonas methanica]